MATVFKNRSAQNPQATKAEKPPRSGHKGRWLLLLALLGGGLWFAPAIASRTSLGDWPLRQALNGIDGTISSGSRTFGWLSSIVYHDVQIRDAKGNVLATIATIRTDKTLSQLALHAGDLGTIRIEQLQAALELRPDGSNLEDVVQPWWSRGTTGAKPNLDLELTDGRIDMHDVAADKHWHIDSISTTVRITSTSALPVEIAAAGAVQTDSGPEKFKLAYSATATSTTPSPKVELQADPLPLEMFRPLMARVLPEAHLSGQLSANLQYLPGATDSTKLLQGSIEATDFTLTAPALGADQIHLAKLSMPCKVNWKSTQLNVEQLGVTCDVADVELTGQIALPLKANLSPADLLSQTYNVQGQLDLAKLAKLLPATLHVRAGTQVTDGQVKLAIDSATADAGHRWNAQLSAERLAATDGVHQVALTQPITATASILDGPTGVTVEKLDCQSSFLHVSGSGTPDQFSLDATYDLKQLGAELGQFFALGDPQLAGDGRSQLHWQRAADGSFQASTSSELHNVHAWLENSFVDEPIAKLDSSGTWNPVTRKLQLGATTLLSSTVSLHTDSAALDWPAEGPPGWTGMITGQADLARLLNWIRDPRSSPAWGASGRLVFEADLAETVSSTSGKLRATIDQFALSGTAPARITPPGGPTTLATSPQGAVWWQEPRIAMSATAAYDHQGDTLQITASEFDSSAFRLSGAGQLQHLTTAPNAMLAGSIDYDGQTLSRLLQTYFGTQIQLAGQQSRPFSFRGPLASPAIAVGNGNGATVPTVLVSSAGQASTASQPWLKSLAAEGSLGWTSAALYGMQAGPGQIDARLANGAIQFNLDNTAVSEGHLTASPSLRLGPGPLELLFGPGPLLTGLHISTPAAQNQNFQTQTTQWVKFVAPMLSGATRTEGRLSIVLQGGRMPLGNPAAADFAGQVNIESIDVTPGPIAHPFALLTKQVESIFLRQTMPQDLAGEPPLVKIGRQSVPFRMVNGRVYHQNLEMTVGNITLRTYGSVGLDESLSLMAEMPVQHEWLGLNANQSPWNNQVVQFTIGGTLHDPKIDPRALEQLASQMVRNTVDQKIVDPLKKDLDRLLHPGQ
jgi:hypothetical protein